VGEPGGVEQHVVGAGRRPEPGNGLRRSGEELGVVSERVAIEARAAFSPDGALLHAGPEASRRLGGAATLAAAGAQELAETALAQGRADGATPVGAVTLQRIGSGNALVLVAIFAPEPRTVDEPAQIDSAKPDVVAPADHSASEQAIEPAAAGLGSPLIIMSTGPPGPPANRTVLFKVTVAGVIKLQTLVGFDDSVPNNPGATVTVKSWSVDR